MILNYTGDILETIGQMINNKLFYLSIYFLQYPTLITLKIFKETNTIINL